MPDIFVGATKFGLDMIKKLVMDLFSEERKSITGKIYDAYYKAQRQFFERYGNEFGDYETCFLSRQENLDSVTKHCARYSTGLLTCQHFNPNGFNGTRSATRSAMNYFIECIYREMFKHDELEKILSTKRFEREISNNLKVITGSNFRRLANENYINLEPQNKNDISYYIPSLPPHLFSRKEEKETIINLLLNHNSQNTINRVPRIVGICGMGGVGKSVLATEIAWDDYVREAFPDGLIWLNVGTEPNLTSLQSSVLEMFKQNNPVIDNVDKGKRYLWDILHDKTCLIILDDIWDLRHLEAFYFSLPGCRYLLTTQDSSIIRTLGAIDLHLEELEEDTALKFLAQWLDMNNAALPLIARKIVSECGRLPLALSMIGSMMRGKEASYWEYIHNELRKADLDRWKFMLPNYKHTSIMKVIQVSVDSLEEIPRQCYLDIAVLLQKSGIPKAAFEVVWRNRGICGYDVEGILRILEDKSLLSFDSMGRISIHDLQYCYIKKVREKDLLNLHKELLRSYSDFCSKGWPSGPDDGYYYQNLPRHLIAAEMQDQLKALLLDFCWLQKKIQITDIKMLLDDFNLLQDQELVTLQKTLLLSSSVVSANKNQLAGQLLGRLLKHIPDGSEMYSLLQQAKQWQGNRWLRPLNSGLIPAGGYLVCTLWGHVDFVNSFVMLSSETKMISASTDMTIRIWDILAGTEECVLRGHNGNITAIAISEDGRRLVSASYDYNVIVWDIEKRKILKTLVGHTDYIFAIRLFDNGNKAITASGDGTLKVWNLDEYIEIITLKGHSAGVFDVLISSDGNRAISASFDETIMFWDLEDYVSLCTLPGSLNKDNLIAVSPAITQDSKTAVWISDNYTLKVWNLEKKALRCTLKGHLGSIFAIAVTKDGSKVVSASDDKTIKIWDIASCKEIYTLCVHTGSPYAVFLSMDEKVVVATSTDKTIRVWSMDTGKELYVLSGHTSKINKLQIGINGKRIFSASDDTTIRVWDINCDVKVNAYDIHTENVSALCFTPDGTKLISVSFDKTVKVWDAISGDLIHTLKGHNGNIYAMIISPNGEKIITASFDRTIKVWNIYSGEELLSIAVEKYRMDIFQLSKDGYELIIDSFNNVIRIYELENGSEMRAFKANKQLVSKEAVALDTENIILVMPNHSLNISNIFNGTEMATLYGHTDKIYSIAINKNRDIVASASLDNTIRTWDLNKGSELAVLACKESAINTLAVSEDGYIVATASDDRAFRIWDMRSGKLIADFIGESQLTSCAIDANHSTFAVGGLSGEVHILKLDGLMNYC